MLITSLGSLKKNAKTTKSYFNAEQKLQPQSGQGKLTKCHFVENNSYLPSVLL